MAFIVTFVNIKVSSCGRVDRRIGLHVRILDSVHDYDDCIDWNITNVFFYQLLRLVGIMPAKSYPHFLDFSSLCHQGKVTRENFPIRRPRTSFAWLNHESTGAATSSLSSNVLYVHTFQEAHDFRFAIITIPLLPLQQHKDSTCCFHQITCTASSRHAVWIHSRYGAFGSWVQLEFNAIQQEVTF